MNENLNLEEILKDCPKGTKLYSTILGEVKLYKVKDNNTYPIGIEDKEGAQSWLTSNGKFMEMFDGECTLFPSKEQRDWSKFKHLVKPKFKVGDKIVNIHWKRMGSSRFQSVILKITKDKYIFTDGIYSYISNQDDWELVSDKKSKFDPKTLQPFDKILVRDRDSENWTCGFFSHKDESMAYSYRCVGTPFIYCIPYNDDTKHLVGTTEEAPEYYRYWEE